MRVLRHIYRILALAALMLTTLQHAMAQDTLQTRVPKAQLRRTLTPVEFLDSLSADSIRRVQELLQQLDSAVQDQAAADTIVAPHDELPETTTDTLKAALMSVHIPTEQELANTLLAGHFVPDPKKAMWLAIVFPGGGQIYNRKYWKLPIIYGGFLGCVYALNWNNMMYRDYSQAYIDIMDSDPNTKSYENFIPRGYDIERNLTRIKDLFRRKKDYYRRYRDLSIFAMIGVYALSIVDAYVDAELSSFDISRDLSMKVSPSVIRQGGELAVRQPYGQQAYGVRCSVSF